MKPSYRKELIEEIHKNTAIINVGGIKAQDDTLIASVSVNDAIRNIHEITSELLQDTN